MQWKVRCLKSSGQLRKQFSQWAIPKALRDKFGIRDQDKLLIQVVHLNYVENHWLNVSSGGEIYVPSDVASRLAEQAQRKPKSSIEFTLVFDEVPESPDDFDSRVRDSFNQTIERRARLQGRLNSKDPMALKPSVRRVVTKVYVRNPDVVAEVLYRAEGSCEGCGKEAPFFRSSDGSPYLEVHHRNPLAEGGDDTVENAIALCPNCHREFHFGLNQAESETSSTYGACDFTLARPMSRPQSAK